MKLTQKYSKIFLVATVLFLAPYSSVLAQNSYSPYYGGLYKVKKGDSQSYQIHIIHNNKTAIQNYFKLENKSFIKYTLENGQIFNLTVLDNNNTVTGTNQIFYKLTASLSNIGKVYSPILETSLSFYKIPQSFLDSLFQVPIIPSFSNQENAYSYLMFTLMANGYQLSQFLNYNITVDSQFLSLYVQSSFYYISGVNCNYLPCTLSPAYNYSIIKYNWKTGLLVNYVNSQYFGSYSTGVYKQAFEYEIIQTPSTNLIDSFIIITTDFFPYISIVVTLIILSVFFVSFKRFKKANQNSKFSFTRYIKSLKFNYNKTKIQTDHDIDKSLETINTIIKENMTNEN